VQAVNYSAELIQKLFAAIRRAMNRALQSRPGIRRTAMALIVIALMVRMIVPQGWMPVRGAGFVVSICTPGDGMMQVVLGKDGKLHDLPDDRGDKKPGGTCAG
jgi:hypothetical protein